MTVPHLFAAISIDPVWLPVLFIAGIVVGYAIFARDRSGKR